MNIITYALFFVILTVFLVIGATYRNYELSAIGFIILFIINAAFLSEGIEYTTGETKTINASSLNMTLEETNYTYTTYSNFWISFLLIIISVTGLAEVLLSIKLDRGNGNG